MKIKSHKRDQFKNDGYIRYNDHVTDGLEPIAAYADGPETVLCVQIDAHSYRISLSPEEAECLYAHLTLLRRGNK